MPTQTEAKPGTKNPQKLEQLLNQQVANLNVLYTKLHHFHWFVKGENFFTLHAKFQELYEEVTLQLDEVAERLLALKLKPVSSLKDSLAAATIKEAGGNENATQMVQQIIADFTQLRQEAQGAITFAEEQEDSVTADLLTGIAASLDKHVWMLNAYLAK